MKWMWCDVWWNLLNTKKDGANQIIRIDGNVTWNHVHIQWCHLSLPLTFRFPACYSFSLLGCLWSRLVSSECMLWMPVNVLIVAGNLCMNWKGLSYQVSFTTWFTLWHCFLLLIKSFHYGISIHELLHCMICLSALFFTLEVLTEQSDAMLIRGSFCARNWLVISMWRKGVRWPTWATHRRH